MVQRTFEVKEAAQMKEGKVVWMSERGWFAVVPVNQRFSVMLWQWQKAGCGCMKGWSTCSMASTFTDLPHQDHGMYIDDNDS